MALRFSSDQCSLFRIKEGPLNKRNAKVEVELKKIFQDVTLQQLIQETRMQRLAVWKRCDLLVQFVFSYLMASDLII